MVGKLSQSLSRSAPIWILLLFLVLPLLAFPELVFGRQTLYWTDLTWIHYPRHLFTAQEWLAGRVPLWDPYEDTGTSLLAESQVGVLYPPSLLFLSPLPPSLELSLFILLHFSLAALFAFGLGRLLGLNHAAATLVGLAFGFGGFLMVQVANLNIMTGAAWLPMILAAAILTVRQRRWLGAMLAGLPLTLQIFTAQPQIVFYTLAILGSYGLYRIVGDFLAGPGPTRRNFRYALQTTGLLAILLLTGLLLAAPQLLPTLELQQLSVRSAERGPEFLTENSLPPPMWLNLLVPGAFGNNVTGFKGGDPFQEVFIYAGFIPLLLAAVGLGCLRHERLAGDRLFFGLLLVGTALMAMGSHTPLYEHVVKYLPGFSLFRIPSRWLMGSSLALAVLAGLGFEAVLQRGLSRSQATFLGLLAVGVAGGVLLAGWAGPSWLARYGAGWDDFYQKLGQAFIDKAFQVDPVYRGRLLLGWVPGLAAPGFLLLANAGVIIGLVALRASRRCPLTAWAALIILATALDLTLAGGTTINPIRPESWWQRLSGGARYVLENKGQGRVFPLGMGSEAAAVSHLGQYFPSVYAVYSAGGHGSSLRLARYDTFLHEADPVQALRVLGVRYLLALGQMGPDVASTYPLVYSDAESFVYENRQALPRVFVVHRAIQANSPAEALSYFQSRTIDPAETVILEAEGPVPAAIQPKGAARGTVSLVAEDPQAIQVKVRLASTGYLVLLDTFYPGWQASVDDQPVLLYRANYIGRAVFVPAGEHTIRFEYRPLSFKAGQVIALLMLAILVATALLSGPLRLAGQPGATLDDQGRDDPAPAGR